MIIKDVYNLKGEYLVYDKNKDSYTRATVHIPCAKITYKDNGIPVIDIIDTGEGRPLYYIAVNEED